jgi:hypothetical protein
LSPYFPVTYVPIGHGIKERISATALWNGSPLPSEAYRNIFVAAKK